MKLITPIDPIIFQGEGSIWTLRGTEKINKLRLKLFSG